MKTVARKSRNFLARFSDMGRITPLRSPSFETVNYGAEEEAYNPRHMSCSERFRLEWTCKNANFSVWTSLGRLEWADAYGRGGGLCGSRSVISPGTWRYVRLAQWIITFAILVHSLEFRWHSGEWLYYLTNWTLILITLYQTFALILTRYLHNEREPPLQMTLLARVTWAIHSVALPASVYVSIGYWIMQALFDVGATFQDDWTLILEHGVLGLLLLVDYALSAQPFMLIHFIYGLLYMLVYLIWTAIHYSLKLGPVQPNGEIYIYPPLNWKYPKTIATGGLPIGFFFALMHIVIWFFGMRRDVPYKHYKSTLQRT